MREWGGMLKGGMDRGSGAQTSRPHPCVRDRRQAGQVRWIARDKGGLYRMQRRRPGDGEWVVASPGGRDDGGTERGAEGAARQG